MAVDLPTGYPGHQGMTEQERQDRERTEGRSLLAVRAEREELERLRWIVAMAQHCLTKLGVRNMLCLDCAARIREAKVQL